MALNTLLVRLAAGIVGGAVGFMAGILVLLAIGGTDFPDWGPIVAAGGAGLVGGAGLAIATGCVGRCLMIALVALGVVGGLVGFFFGVIGDSYVLTIGAVGVVLILAAGLAPWWRSNAGVAHSQ